MTGADENRDGFFNDRPTINGVHFARNSFRQPDFYQLDFRLAKTFYVASFGSSMGSVGLTAIVDVSIAPTRRTDSSRTSPGGRPRLRLPPSASPTA